MALCPLFLMVSYVIMCYTCSRKFMFDDVKEVAMVEILFGESEAASMKAAKNKIVIDAVNGPTSVFIAGKKIPPSKPFTGWIEGTAEEVICLGFMLDIGNIKEPVDSVYRKELLYSMYAQNQWEQDNEWDNEMKKVGEFYINELFRLNQFLDNGEMVRIWYSDAPYSRCGFYHLCRTLEKYENEVRVVKLPEYVIREKSITAYKNWSEVAAEEFAEFLSYEKRLSKEEVRMYAILWSDLVEDNSPLRSVINGKVLGVPEDFYDFQIWKRLTENPVNEARLIGDILGNSQISIGDWWYAKRIEYYIQHKKIHIVEDAVNKYARTICLAKD